MKKDFVIPILVMAFICLFMSSALAFVNGITLPIITAAAAERAEAAMMEIIPNAEEFVPVELTEDMPGSIQEVFRTTNDVGYIFVTSVRGFGGSMNIMTGIDPDGLVIKTLTLGHSETRGISDPVFAQEPLYIGKDSNLEGIDVISGATITFVAYINGVRDAFEAFDIVRGA